MEPGLLCRSRSSDAVMTARVAAKPKARGAWIWLEYDRSANVSRKNNGSKTQIDSARDDSANRTIKTAERSLVAKNTASLARDDSVKIRGKNTTVRSG